MPLSSVQGVEATVDDVEHTPLLKSSRKSDPQIGRPGLILAAFFALGAASDISWNAIYMSVAYFEKRLGQSVLSDLGLAQNIPWLVVMMVLTFFRSRQANVSAMYWGTSLTHVYMFGMCMAFPLLIYLDLTMPTTVLYALVILNGVATGLSQAYVAQLSGVFSRYSCSKGASAWQLIGASFGISLPPLVQVCLLPSMLSAKTDGDTYDTTILAVQIIFPAACVVLLASVVALFLLYKYSRLLNMFKTDQDLEAHLSKLGNIPHPTIKNFPLFSWQRFRIIWFVAGFEAMTATVSSYITALSPFVDASRPDSVFWKHYLSTVILIVFSFSSFLGRYVGEMLPSRFKGLSFFRSLSGMVLLFLLRLVLVGGLLFYVLAPSSDTWVVRQWDVNNLCVLGVYSLLSLIGGIQTVCLSNMAQERCNHCPVEPCIIVAQIIWLSLQAGACIGIGLSELH